MTGLTRCGYAAVAHIARAILEYFGVTTVAASESVLSFEAVTGVLVVVESKVTPSRHGVAFIAAFDRRRGNELPAVDVCMAALAVGALEGKAPAEVPGGELDDGMACHARLGQVRTD
jgi:hypothetical protein